MILDCARQFLYVREAAANTGARVEGIQRWCGGKPGDSWCCHFATFVLDIERAGQSPLPRTGSCDELLASARRLGMEVSTPEAGDLYFLLTTPQDAHHVGFVTDVSDWANNRLGTLSGNTSPDGTSSNGDGVHEHAITVADRSRITFARAF